MSINRLVKEFGRKRYLSETTTFRSPSKTHSTDLRKQLAQGIEPEHLTLRSRHRMHLVSHQLQASYTVRVSIRFRVRGAHALLARLPREVEFAGPASCSAALLGLSLPGAITKVETA